jgi:hypothetical protein
MHTAAWNTYDARDDVSAGRFDIERLIRAIDSSADDDFELGEPWDGHADMLDDDPE